MSARASLPLLLLLALAGCPTETKQGTGPTSAPAPTPVPPVPPVPPVAQPAPQPPPPPQPAAQADPAPGRGIPAPDDGRDQLALHQPQRIVVGTVPVQAWIADTNERRQLGLMHVQSLPVDHGMLFVYPRARRLSFWMRNTRIPLSIAYISDDGVIAQIEDMEPFDERTHPSRKIVRFALEMPKGWFQARGIGPGVAIEGILGLEGYGE